MRSVGPDSFSADPLRVLRLARMAAELGFTREQETLRLAAESAPALSGVAAERVFAELRLTHRQRPGGRRASNWRTASVPPPSYCPSWMRCAGSSRATTTTSTSTSTRWRRCSRRSIWRAIRSPPSASSEPALRQVLDEPLANELTRGQALRFGALLHDIAKPLTHAISSEGRPTFFEHDVRGAETGDRDPHAIARQRALDHARRRARASTTYGSASSCTSSRCPPRTIYRYLATCEPVEVDVTVLSVADRAGDARAQLRAGGDAAPRPGAARCSRTRSPGSGSARDRRSPATSSRMRSGSMPGPQLGRLLAELTEAVVRG